MSEKIIEVRNLVRDYETYTGILVRKKKIVNAVKDISFEVFKGEVFGLLGPNGAGKTTTIKVLTTLLTPTQGSVKVFGQDVVQDYQSIRNKINCLFGGERSLYWRLTAEDNLKYFSDIYKIPYRVQKKKIPELLELVGLKDWSKIKVETFSKGMKQRLQIARCLINDPEILLLDEPTIGLDPKGGRELRQLVLDLKEMKKTILLTTHYMYEAEELCDRIALINKGVLVDLDTPDNLKKKAADLVTMTIRCKKMDEETMAVIRNLQFVDSVTCEDKNGLFELQILVKYFVHCGDLLPYLRDTDIVDIFTHSTSLEDAYLKMVVS